MVEDSYANTAEVDYLRLVVGIVDANEDLGRWDGIVCPSVPGQVIGRGSPYRSAAISLACIGFLIQCGSTLKMKGAF